VRVPETPRSARRLRVAVAALVSVGLLVPLAALGASTSGQTASAAQYKITICHHTHSKKHPNVTIRISNKAWPAHQRHGDTMGACAAAKAKHGKGHQNADKGKGHQNSDKGKGHENGNKHNQQGSGNSQHGNGNSGAQPSNTQAQSPSHANEHANEHAKSHGK
jgi:hypothetical protein